MYTPPPIVTTGSKASNRISRRSKRPLSQNGRKRITQVLRTPSSGFNWNRASALLGPCRGALPDPEPVAIWIIKPKLGHAIKSDSQVGNSYSVVSHLPVIGRYVVGIQIHNGLARRVSMNID